MSNPRVTMSYAAYCLSYEHACQAIFDGDKIEFSGINGHYYVIEHMEGDKYQVQGPSISKVIDISHLMGDNNGVWLANKTLEVIGQR